MWEGSPQKQLCLYNKWTHTEHPFLQYSSLTRFFWCSVPTSIYSIVYFLKESIKQICISVFYIFKDPETKISSQFSSVQSLSHVRLFATPWIAARQASLSPTPRVHWDSCPSSQWCYPAITSSVVPFSSCPNPSQHQGLFQGVSSSQGVAKILEFQFQHQSFQWIFRTDILK